jgi:hypothetical protein
MSITFFASKQDKDGLYCMVPDSPELNLSNSNAYRLLTMLGCELEAVDFWEEKELASLEDLIACVMLDSSRRAEQVRETEQFTGTNGCKIICCGTSDEQWFFHLMRLREIVSFAIRHNAVVFWA